MTGEGPPPADDRPGPAPGPARGGAARLARFGALASVGWLVVVLAVLPLLALLGSAAARWAPLVELDRAILDGLNAVVAPRPALVLVLRGLTAIGGGGAAWVLLPLAVVILLLRRDRARAAYLAVAGLGLAVLVPVSKALVGRPRPEVPVPVVDLPTNPSFPSGHAMIAVVLWGALLLVALSVWRPARRAPWVALATAVMVLVGSTRLALGVHVLSDVLAGWGLGAAWLGVTTVTFRAALDAGRRTGPDR